MMRSFFYASLLSALSFTAEANPSIVVDAASGAVLSEEEAGRPWLPASLTKMMTAYVALKAVQQGRLGMDSGLVISAKATKQAPSKMGFKVGTTLSLDHALKIIMVKSANDVSVAIAEGVGGSVESFVSMMNAEAANLGMSGSRFANPNGLPGGQQSTTARDMAVLARALLSEFPQHGDLWGIPAIQFGQKIIRTHNHLIGRYPGADGFKTGFVCASGFNVVATASRGNRKLITVVLGATTAKERADQAARLFDKGFSSWNSMGSLNTVQNYGGPVANIREQVCRRRGKQVIMPESGEEFDAQQPTQDKGFLAAFFSGGQSTAGTQIDWKSYVQVMDPVPVTINTVRPMAGMKAVAAPVQAKKAKKAVVQPEALEQPVPVQQSIVAPEQPMQRASGSLASPAPAFTGQRPAGSLMSLPASNTQRLMPGSLMPAPQPQPSQPMSLTGAALEPSAQVTPQAPVPQAKPQQKSKPKGKAKPSQQQAQ